LDELPIKPEVALYYQGKRIRKTQPVSGFSLLQLNGKETTAIKPQKGVGIS
jgi:hypothetical protein